MIASYNKMTLRESVAIDFPGGVRGYNIYFDCVLFRFEEPNAIFILYELEQPYKSAKIEREPAEIKK